MNKPVLTIVVPCFNEEEVLNETSLQLSAVLRELMEESLVSQESKLLFVDDGSKDRTWEIIETESENNLFVTGLKLAGNVGHQMHS
jgi:polyisoprenyl-phosphate glycosyltransferase